MRTRTTISIAAATAVVLVLIATLSLSLRRSSKFVPTPLPVPNGYDDLVQAGQSIPKETGDFNRMSQAELRKVVDGNSNALQIARLGLTKKVQVPLTNSINFLASHPFELVQLRSIAHGFISESKLAEMEQRTNDAVRSSMDAIRLGAECQRGGILLDGLIGIAIESIGTSQLEHFVTALDAKSCREIARELEDLDAQGQTWEEVLDQEHYWSHKTFPGLNYTVARLFTLSQTRAMEVKGRTKFIAQEIKNRKLMIELAARAYELENNRRPNSTRDLAPEYLKTVPQDPTTGTNLTYLP